MAELRKDLGFVDVFAIAAGAMISSGLFVLPGLAFARCGPAVTVAYLLAGLIALPALLSKCELTTAMPKSGGDYFFIERSLGTVWGTMGGLATWFSLTFKSAFALIGLGASATLLWPDLSSLQLRLISAAFCLLFMVVNLVGARHVGRFQVFLVFGLLVLLSGYVVLGAEHGDSQRLVPFVPMGWGSVLATAGLVFVSFGGLTKAAAVAEEVHHPKRNLPLGMITAYLVVTGLYVLVIAVTVRLLPPEELSRSLCPIAEGAGSFMGPLGHGLLTLAAVLAFVSTANAGLMAASRAPMAMSRDGLLPPWLARVNRSFGTPHPALLVTGGLMILVIAALDLEDLVKTASTLKLILFLLVTLSVVIMRESRIQTYRPSFLTPLYPAPQILGIFAYALLVLSMGWLPLMLSALFVLGSLAWWAVWVRPRVSNQSAMIQVVQRVAGQDLAHSHLSDELREILRDRDLFPEDRFDRLLRDCPILDLPEESTRDEVFHLAAEALAPALSLTAEEVFDLLRSREGETSTVLTSMLAVPHVIVPGENCFELLLIRCRGGIDFGDAGHDLRCLFVMAGSEDERNFHLRALMAIAQIARNADFETRWMESSSPESLRNLCLVAKRSRSEGG